jgi:hypothetical protein
MTPCSNRTSLARIRWRFRELQILRRTPFLRPGRPTRPQGEHTLTLSANADVNPEFLHYLQALQAAYALAVCNAGV